VKKYRVKEIFWSLQGEGVRAGEASIFLRFANCNLRCAVRSGPLSPGGFDCDTDFIGGSVLSTLEVVEAIERLPLSDWVILTGGEPTLQVETGDELLHALIDAGFHLAIETNGTMPVPAEVEWVTVSPKVAEDKLRVTKATEVKYVRGYGQPVPETTVQAAHYLISPAFSGENLDPKTLAWCVGLVQSNPKWRLSVQQHKQWGLP